MSEEDEDVRLPIELIQVLHQQAAHMAKLYREQLNESNRPKESDYEIIEPLTPTRSYHSLH